MLVDGYFWNRANFLNVSELLLHFRDLIRWYGVIPGYAGELLIESSADSSAPLLQPAATSQAIRSAYTSHYYLSDCGGYDVFKRSRGRVLDARLQALYDLSFTAPDGMALDLGCGRGELAIALASGGRQVTAIDYSENAIELARTAARDAGVLDRVEFLCADASSVELHGNYAVALAGDLIEHMAPAELDNLYHAVARALTPEGMFIAHTYPNLWFYRYEHARELRLRSLSGHTCRRTRAAGSNA